MLHFTTGKSHSFGVKYLELIPHERLRYTDNFDDPNLPGEIQVTIMLKKGLRRDRLADRARRAARQKKFNSRPVVAQAKVEQSIPLIDKQRLLPLKLGALSKRLLLVVSRLGAKDRLEPLADVFVVDSHPLEVAKTDCAPSASCSPLFAEEAHFRELTVNPTSFHYDDPVTVKRLRR